MLRVGFYKFIKKWTTKMSLMWGCVKRQLYSQVLCVHDFKINPPVPHGYCLWPCINLALTSQTRLWLPPSHTTAEFIKLMGRGGCCLIINKIRNLGSWGMT
jgi:hypothetical protein